MKSILSIIAIFITVVTIANAQDATSGSILPNVKIKALNGEVIGTDKLMNDGKPIIISFWATWCKPCVNELNTINEVYSTWQKETGVKLIAISVDDARTMASVAPFINGKGWDYEVYLDPNGDFKRAMNVNMVPHTFLLNSKREIVDQHTSFAPGDEDKLFEKIQNIAAGKPVN